MQMSFLKRLRITRGCSRSFLAQKVGLSELSLLKYENNPKSLLKAKLENVHKLAEFYQIDLETFYELIKK